MSFRATIGSADRHAAWYRGIYVLGSIDEKIKITISEDEIILWSIHNTDTSLCQQRYNKAFFDEFEFKPHEIVFGDNGLQIETDLHGNEHKLYSFEVQAKHLTTVSRKPDNDIIKKFVLAVNNTTACPESLTNRFLVTVEMESLITKEYSPNFVPIKYIPILVDLQYKRKFLDVYGGAMYDHDQVLDPALVACFKSVEHELSLSLFNKNERGRTNGGRGDRTLDSSDEINYISCDQALVKNFVENCNTSVFDDVKLELFEKKLTITAFTKGIFKSSEILQNAISMSNTMSTSDLGNYCLFNIEEADFEDGYLKHRKRQNNANKSIIFKLKDFKNFISIGTSIKNFQLNMVSTANSNNNSNNIGIWFCRPGEPILFQMNKGGIITQLILVTDSDQFTVNNISPIKNVVGSGTDRTRYNTTSPVRIDETTVKKARLDESASRIISKTIASPVKLNANFRDVVLAQPNSIRDNRVSPLKDTILKKTPSSISNKNFPTTHGKLNPRKLFVNEYSQESDNEIDSAGSPNKSASNYPSEMDARNVTKSKMDDLTTNLERSETTVGWGKRYGKVPSEGNAHHAIQKEDMNRKQILKQEKMKYLKAKAQNQQYEDNNTTDDTDDEFGPTQVIRPKGLFD